MAKILTVFFSLKGENLAPGDKTVYLEKGNTAVAAEFIQKTIGSDIFEIETVKTYKKDYMEMINEARKNRRTASVRNLRHMQTLTAAISSFLAIRTGGEPCRCRL